MSLQTATGNMLVLGDPGSPLPASLAHAAGGFAWWYLDGVNDAGDGLVIIAALGLPFLPGYANSDRQGDAPTCGQRPSINVVVYRAHKPIFYTLYEADSSSWTWLEPEGISIESSRFLSEQRGPLRQVDIDLDCPVPGTTDRLVGTVRMTAAAVQLPHSVSNTGAHAWTPLCTAGHVDVDLRVGQTSLISGSLRGYHDRNGSEEALHRLGIHHWLWGRVAAPDAEHIYYALWPDDDSRQPEFHGLTILSSGEVRVHSDVAVERKQPTRGHFGMPYWSQLDVTIGGHPWLSVPHNHLVDDGFFYGRFIGKAIVGDQQAPFVSEIVWPHRVDLGWHRWLVNMALHTKQKRSSMWLPLFAGTMNNRWQRLAQWWLT